MKYVWICIAACCFGGYWIGCTAQYPAGSIVCGRDPSDCPDGMSCRFDGNSHEGLCFPGAAHSDAGGDAETSRTETSTGSGGAGSGGAGSSGASGRAGGGGASGRAGSGGASGKAGSGGASGKAGSGGASGDPDNLPFCEISANEGKACDDGEHCTEGETCQDGECTGGTEVICPESSEPCKISMCSEASAGCITRSAADGESCGSNGRTCQDGACTCPGGVDRETACGDGADNDCDGQSDCADPDCETLQCPGSTTKRCCSGACVDIATDENNCGQCGKICPKPPAYSGGQPALEMCSYVQECNYPNSEAGTVCRLYEGAQGCDGSPRAHIEECTGEANLDSVCGGITPPFWICTKDSKDCTLISAF